MATQDKRLKLIRTESRNRISMAPHDCRAQLADVEMFQIAMASGDITIELPQNFRGYQPAHIRFDGSAGRRAYAWMRQTCDGYSTPSGYING